MQPDSPKGVSANLSSPCFLNSAIEEERSQKMLETFKMKLKGHLTTSDLARCILKEISPELIYEFKNVHTIKELILPYRIKAIHEALCELKPIQVLKCEPRINCMAIITNTIFKFYFKLDRSNIKKTEISCSFNPPAKQPQEPYVIFFATTCWSHQLKEKTIVEGEDKFACYHYCSAQLSKIKIAPFHHESQNHRAGCGLYALNAYLGYHHFSLQSLAQFLNKRGGIAGNEKLDAPFNFEDFLKTFKGFDYEELEWVLNELADKKPYDTQKVRSLTGGFVESDMFGVLSDREVLQALKEVDRFILGIGKLEAHFITFRKDVTFAWWKIDSILPNQEGFETDAGLLAYLKSDYKEYVLHFILPNIHEKK